MITKIKHAPQRAEIRSNEKFIAAITRALNHLENGEPAEAIVEMQDAEAICTLPDDLKLIQKAIDEADCGSCEKSETFLQMILTPKKTKAAPEPRKFFRHACQLQIFACRDITDPDVQEQIIESVLNAIPGITYSVLSGISTGADETDTQFAVDYAELK